METSQKEESQAEETSRPTQHRSKIMLRELENQRKEWGWNIMSSWKAAVKSDGNENFGLRAMMSFCL